MSDFEPEATQGTGNGSLLLTRYTTWFCVSAGEDASTHAIASCNFPDKHHMKQSKTSYLLAAQVFSAWRNKKKSAGFNTLCRCKNELPLAKLCRTPVEMSWDRNTPPTDHNDQTKLSVGSRERVFNQRHQIAVRLVLPCIFLYHIYIHRLKHFENSNLTTKRNTRFGRTY